MKQSSKCTPETIVMFHIGRGGRFHNAGHKSFVGIRLITESSVFEKYLYLNFENQNDLFRKIKNHPNLVEKYYECCDNEDFAWFENKLKFKIGEQIFTNCNGDPVGLTVKEANAGIGCIDMDGGYDTTYTCMIKDLDEGEISILEESNDIEAEWALEVLK